MAKKITNRTVVKFDGDTGNRDPKRVVEVVPGPHPYLWIGDESDCYGTISGKRLTALLNAIADEGETDDE